MSHGRLQADSAADAADVAQTYTPAAIGRRHQGDQHADGSRSLPDSPRHRRLRHAVDRRLWWSQPGSQQDHRQTSNTPKNVRITVRGAVVNMNQSFTRFAIGLLLSIALVYLILMAQFTSFIDPFIILMAIPPGLAGVVLILLVTRQHAEHHVADGRDHDDRHRGFEQHSDR